MPLETFNRQRSAPGCLNSYRSEMLLLPSKLELERTYDKSLFRHLWTLREMDSVKTWLTTKSSGSNSRSNSFREKGSKYPSVVTPDNIPTFVIPRTVDSHSRDTDEIHIDGNISDHSSDGRTSSTSPSPAPPRRHPPSALRLGPPSPSNCSSAPVSPNRTRHKRFSTIKEAVTFSSLENVREINTNWDPQSFIAMSLEHFKITTPFGFTTLKESPHVRRKESLFHDSDTSPIRSPHSPLSNGKKRIFNSSDSLSRLSPTNGTPHERARSFDNTATKFNSDWFQGAAGGLDIGRTSPNSFSSGKFPISPGAKGNIWRRSPRRSRYYSRRRSSLFNTQGKGENDGDSSSESGGSSGEASPKLCRKMKLDNLTVERGITPSPSQSSDISSSCSCTSLNKLESQLVAELGEIKISIQYFLETKILKIILIKAENLGGPSKCEQIVSSFAKLYLLPDKDKKQTSQVIKTSRHPIYNEEFHFQNITWEELQEKTLRIKIMNKGTKFTRQDFIGEIHLPLGSMNTLNECRMWKNLEPKVEIEELGYLQLSMKIDPRADRLTLTIIKAKHLPKHSVMGSPDAYVKLEVVQSGNVHEDHKKQTKTPKKSRNPVFKEAFAFNISTRNEDLASTAVNLTVMNREVLRSDSIIGQIRLGFGATENSEIKHWNKVMEHPYKEFTEWHALMEYEDDNFF